MCWFYFQTISRISLCFSTSAATTLARANAVSCLGYHKSFLSSPLAATSFSPSSLFSTQQPGWSFERASQIMSLLCTKPALAPHFIQSKNHNFTITHPFIKSHFLLFLPSTLLRPCESPSYSLNMLETPWPQGLCINCVSSLEQSSVRFLDS